jgi:Domain of unknown function DUF11
MLRRSRARWAVFSSGLCCALFFGTNFASGEEGSSPSADDPRSGAALNVLAAKKIGKLRLPEHPARRILKGTVNNPGADATARDTQSETTLIDLGGGKLVAAWNDSGSWDGISGGGNDHFTGYGFSSNNGKTWTDAGALPNTPGGDAGDPVLAFHAGTGAVFFATLEFSNLLNIHVFKSTDSGHTFALPVNGTPGVPGQQDKPWLTVDNFGGTGNGNAYLCWTQFNPTGSIRFTRSTDGGASFGPSGGLLLSSGGQGCFVVVAPNHNVFVFFYRGTGGGGQGGDNKLFVRRSTDRGVTFAAEVQVADLNTTTVNGNLQLNGGLRSNSFPHAAASSDGNLYAVFNDDPNIADASDNGDVFFVGSTDGGATWSAKTRVPGDATRDQFFATIGFAAGSNRAMISYYSCSQDPANFAFHRRGVLAKVNAAGNLRFNSNDFQLAPNTPIVIGQDPAINATYMGDYDQIAGGTNYVSGTWADNRLGNAFHTRQPDVRFARIKARQPAANLAVSLTASDTSINVGDNTTVTVTLSATGGPANDVFFNVSPTAGLPIQSLSSGGSCALVNGFAGCSLGAIPAGGSKAVDVVVNGQSAGTRTFRATTTTSSNDGAGGDNADTIDIVVSP